MGGLTSAATQQTKTSTTCADLHRKEICAIPCSVENSPAIHGWDSWPAIFQSPVRDERPLWAATTFSAVPAGLLCLANAFPSLERLGYCHRITPRRNPFFTLTGDIVPGLFPLPPRGIAPSRLGVKSVSQSPIPISTFRPNLARQPDLCSTPARTARSVE
jgi:hypothetical protein